MARFLAKLAQLVLMMSLLLLAGCGKSSISVGLSDEELSWIGDKIFANECNRKIQCLIHWNDGEEFPSLGIGHFIWYPAKADKRFVESFPQLVAYIEAQGFPLPDDLKGHPLIAPWSDKAAFEQEVNHPRMKTIRQFLVDTQAWQVEFMLHRAEKAFADILQQAKAGHGEAIENNIQALLKIKEGAYALIDYVNFKGEGLAQSERYQGVGWGLKQVLEEMAINGLDSGSSQSEADRAKIALESFRKAAEAVFNKESRIIQALLRASLVARMAKTCSYLSDRSWLSCKYFLEKTGFFSHIKSQNNTANCS